MKMKRGGQRTLRLLDLITVWTVVIFAEKEKPENSLGFILERGLGGESVFRIEMPVGSRAVKQAIGYVCL